MPKDTVSLPMIGRAAEVVPASVDAAARTIEIVWTTGATVQRYRWEGWDVVEYDEELVVEDGAVRMERMNAGVPFLNSHWSYDLSSVLGSVVPGSARIEDGKGYATVQLSAAADVADIVTRILERSVRSVSVGYAVHRYEITKQDGQRDLWRATDWEPMEISAVAMPADPGAHIRSGQSGRGAPNDCVMIRHGATAAPAAPKRNPTMPNAKTGAGGGNETVRSEENTEAQAVVPETRATPTPPPAPPVADATAIVTAERARVAEITRLCDRAGLDGAVRDRLINDGASIDAARSSVLDAMFERDNAGPIGSTVHAQPKDDGAKERAYGAAMSAALLHRADPGKNDLPADAREFRGMSLLEMGRDALSRRGVSTRGLSKFEVASQAMQMRSAGYHTTSDFPMILADVANKTLRAAYEGTPRTFMAWCRRVTLVDFKPVNRVQLGGAPELLKLNETGEFQFGTMGESKEAYALATYGRRIGFSRQLMINDDLDALTRVPAAFGAAAADLEGDIVYALLMAAYTMSDSVALFHANHGNLLTASVINEAGLTAAFEAFAKMKGIEGRSITVAPRYILVPPGTRAVEALKQLTQTTPGSTSEVNPYASSGLEPIVERRLFPSSGQHPWFLAADPARIDTIEYAYLEGQEGVYTEMRNGFEVDGMEIKARHDFAAAPIDWRGLMKNPGAAPA